MDQTPTVAIAGLTTYLGNLLMDQNHDEARKYYSYPFRHEVKIHAENAQNAGTAVQSNLLLCIQKLDIKFAEDPLDIEGIKKELDVIEQKW